MEKETLDFRNFDLSCAYSKAAVFDREAITLLNRLAEKSGAKFVLHSNWRRSVGHENAKTTLIKNGLKESYFHEYYHCAMKMSSEKIHDIYFWLNDNKKRNKSNENYKIECIVIDDDSVSGDEDLPQVFTNYKEGFTSDSYRLAALLLGVDDPQMEVTILSEEELTVVKSIFPEGRNSNYRMCKWLSKFPEGYISSRSCLISKKISASLSKKSNNIFMPSIDPDGLYTSRSSVVYQEIEYIKSENIIPKRIITNEIDLCREYDFDLCGSDGCLPDSVPCIMTKEADGKTPPEYIYAPDGVDGISYLKGVLSILK